MKFVHFFLCLLSLVLISCAVPNTGNTAPIPTSQVTSSSPYADNSHAIDRQKMIFLEQDYFFLEGEHHNLSLNLSVSHPKAYIYHKGFFYTPQGWKPFIFPQKTHRGSNWIKRHASINLSISASRFSEGEGYVVVYACTRNFGKWYCGSSPKDPKNKWMLQPFYLNFSNPKNTEQNQETKNDHCTGTVTSSCPFVKSLLANREGFGKGAQGGLGGEYYYVSSLANEGNGTLREALQKTGPLWIRFSVNGTINLSSGIRVQSQKTIDGRSADISVQAKTFSVDTSACEGEVALIPDPSKKGYNVPACKTESNEILLEYDSENCYYLEQTNGEIICHHRNEFVFFSTRQPNSHLIVTGINFKGGGLDALTLAHKSNNIWVHRNTFSNYGDGLIDITHGATDITISENHFKDHDKGMIIGLSSLGSITDTKETEGNIRVTLARNHFDNVVQRSPRVSWATVHAYNNFFEKWRGYAIGLGPGAQIYLERNIFEPGRAYIFKNITKGYFHEDGSPAHAQWCDNNNVFYPNNKGRNNIPRGHETLNCDETRNFYDYTLIEKESNIRDVSKKP